jgi:DNA-binding transcriptional ArsR family regulator
MADNRVLVTAGTVAPAVASERVEPTGPQLSAAANTFDLLSSPVRLHLVWLAAHGRYDVGTLAARAGVSIATASQHLGKLRLAGLVSGRRQGKRQIYTVDDPHVLALLCQIFGHIAPDGSLAADVPVPPCGDPS